MICIVIPVFNRKKFTQNCLRALYAQTRPADYIIIVDDGSTDGTDKMIREEFPEVIVLKTKGNLYWTASVNLGIRRALALKADHIITLNNDTIPFNTFVAKLLSGARRQPNALIGALDIDWTSQQPYYGGEIIDWKWSRSRFLLNELMEDQRTGLHEVSLFPGRGLLIPRKVFMKVGLFEEKKLPHYMADYDFTLLAARNGFKVYCNYDAKLYTYPEEGGDPKLRQVKSLKNYFKHLFNIKGGGNLKNFTIYTLRNCPTKYFLPFLFIGYIRRIAGYWLK